MLLAYGSLFIATAAQLAVPQLVQNIIDTITNAATAQQILALPAALQAQAAQNVGQTLDQLATTASTANRDLWVAMLGIVIFSVLLGIFSFTQSFNAERISQNVAFDFRNELFSKIQRLSFSYHDKNQTGQLMIRATDDVEKVRLFLGQGLVLALQSIVLLVATLVVLWLTDPSLTLVILPILPIAFVVFMIFGAVTQPLFTQVQIRISALNTVLQENLAGLKVVKAFARESYERERFRVTADNLLSQQLRVARIFSFLFPVVFLIANLGKLPYCILAACRLLSRRLPLANGKSFRFILPMCLFPWGSSDSSST
jgi:ATP-binding cassette subfamily B protein